MKNVLNSKLIKISFFSQVWNRLSRFQKSLLYMLLVASFLIFIYNSGLVHPRTSQTPPAASPSVASHHDKLVQDDQKMELEINVKNSHKKSGAHSFNLNRVSWIVALIFSNLETTTKNIFNCKFGQPSFTFNIFDQSECALVHIASDKMNESSNFISEYSSESGRGSSDGNCNARSTKRKTW